jgi:exopolysaccharide biosynthesis polyprenyl glycosylphosphotransferase
MTTNTITQTLIYPTSAQSLTPLHLKFVLLLGNLLGLLGYLGFSLWWYWRQSPDNVDLVMLGLFGLLLGASWVNGLRWASQSWLRSQIGQSRWLLLGSGEQARQFSRDFNQNAGGKLLTLREAIAEPTASQEMNCVGTLSELSNWGNQSWSGVVMEMPESLSDEQWQLLMKLRLAGTPIYNLADFYETFWQKLPTATLGNTWFALSQGFHLNVSRLNWQLKRLVDLVAAILLLVTLLPLMLLVMLAIRLDSHGPIFYSQVRSGWNSQPFQVYKFRSMYQDAEVRGAQWAQERDPRITRVGYWLRILRIDELPQIWNVLRGEMSLIGPRPERPEFDTKLAEVIPYYDLRYLVKPGITGWAQVMYPYGASVQDAYEKLSYDLYYIKNYSFWLDLVIVFKTLRVVLLGKGR